MGIVQEKQRCLFTQNSRENEMIQVSSEIDGKVTFGCLVSSFFNGHFLC